MSLPSLFRAVVAGLLLLSGSAWALTDAEVVAAIKRGDENAVTDLAAHAANQGKTVAQVVADLVARSPQDAGAITRTGVQANPTNAGQVVTSALGALAASGSATPALRRQVVQGALNGAPGQAASIRSAAIASGMSPAVVNAITPSRSTTRVASASNLLPPPNNNGSGSSNGGGYSSP